MDKNGLTKTIRWYLNGMLCDGYNLVREEIQTEYDDDIEYQLWITKQVGSYREEINVNTFIDTYLNFGASVFIEEDDNKWLPLDLYDKVKRICSGDQK